MDNNRETFGDPLRCCLGRGDSRGGNGTNDDDDDDTAHGRMGWNAQFTSLLLRFLLWFWKLPASTAPPRPNTPMKNSVRFIVIVIRSLGLVLLVVLVLVL